MIKKLLIKQEGYETPCIEEFFVNVEKGFSGSAEGEGNAGDSLAEEYL